MRPGNSIRKRNYQLSIINCQLMITLFLLSSNTADAQRWPFDYWHDGKMILESGDTLKGKIKYSITDDIIQLEQNNRFQSFTARKIVTFEIFDATSSRYRNFYSIPYSFSGGYKAPVFFELLAEGKLTLLSREALENRTSSVGYGYGSYSRVELVNKYFVLNSKGQIDTFTGHKNDMMDLMADRDDEVKKFMKVNRLNASNKNELSKIFEYYNSIVGKK